MWDNITDLLPDTTVLLCAAASFVVPYVIYKVNQKIHKIVDPPWKGDDDSGRQPSQRKKQSNPVYACISCKQLGYFLIFPVTVILAFSKKHML
ncbi:hypothetical protein P5G51_010990 [Virgibacillus sp. 179-BFC.A HS]|uniref:Uncharacterized protein n=1 Tax=Tigheibacillus jepli TaxID=3035914 RepID=A0ABU5CK30_9BACI|nr:hypothetical protein [Virgibacillus sp. 179-BFC.A HS]MDY0405850.1 hypothetical protein [Virgibacillus sp. 179-BFC.A HS]